MINYMHELQEELSEKLELGVKNIQLTGDDELIISGRDDKMLDVLEYFATNCNARLVDQVVNDFGTRMELVDVLFMNHLKARVYVKIGIDSREKKIASISDMYPSARWLEKYQSQFLDIGFLPRATHQEANSPAGKPDASLPWINIQADEFVNKKMIRIG